METLESEMSKLTTERTELEQNLASGKLTSDQLTSASKRLNDIILLIDEKELRWLELSEIG